MPENEKISQSDRDGKMEESKCEQLNGPDLFSSQLKPFSSLHPLSSTAVGGKETMLQNLPRLLSLALSLNKSSTIYPSNALKTSLSIFRALSSKSSSGDGGAGDSWAEGWDGAAVESSPNTSQDYPFSSSSSPAGWDSVSSWSTGLTKDHFDGQAVGVHLSPESQAAAATASLAEVEFDREIEELERENRRGEAFVNGWNDRMMELSALMKQVREPGARGSYLKDSEKAEMYRKHKEDPETYDVERLAKDYRIMRQRVHAILWLKEIEEEEEKKLGRPLDDSVELLLDTFPE